MQLIQTSQMNQRPLPSALVLNVQRIGIRARLGNGTIHDGHRGDGDIVADLNVANYPDGTTDFAIFPNHRAARNADTTGNGASALRPYIAR